MSNEPEGPADGQAESGQRGSDQCFVIAPIGSDGSPARKRTENLIEHVIQPVVEEEIGLDVTVAHKIDRPGNITRQVMELLFEAELVIADLTEHNANVMYELAVRHATGEPVVTIAQKGTKPPFDIGPQRTKFYKNTLGGVQDFKPKLRAAAEAALKEENEPDNPIYRIQESFQMREAAAGNDTMEYILERLEQIDSTVRRTSLQSDSARKLQQIEYHVKDDGDEFVHMFRRATNLLPKTAKLSFKSGEGSTIKLVLTADPREMVESMGIVEDVSSDYGVDLEADHLEPTSP